MFAETTLLKKAWRHDALWTNVIAYHPFIRRIPLFLDTQALLKSQYWTPEELGLFQDKKIQALCENAKTLRFWKKKFTAELQTNELPGRKLLERLPITSKADFRLDAVSDYSDQAQARFCVLDRSSGSTGKPFGFYHDRSYELRSFAICERMFLTAGSGARHTVISMRAKDRMGFAFADYHFFHIRGYHGIRHRLRHLQELVSSARKPIIFFGVSSSLMELSRLAQENTITLPLAAILAAGEELTDVQRKFIERSLGASVYMYYSMSELGRLAFECEQHRLHICEEWAYLEIVDDHDALVPDGTEGRIVATLFDNNIMPFIRYDTGDRGVIEGAPCPCGRTLRTMQLRGRHIELIRFDDGRTVSPLDMTGILHRNLSAVQHFQIVRTDMYEFYIRVTVGRRFDTARHTIEDQLRRLLHPKVTITFDTDTPIVPGPNGKTRVFIDETRPIHV